jgi:hypothetical protein
MLGLPLHERTNRGDTLTTTNEPNKTQEAAAMANETIERERKYIQEQYEMLKRCSDAKDMSEWNERRMKNLDEKIHLEGADFKRANLQGANLGMANLKDAMFNVACLEGAILTAAHLERAEFFKTRLKGAKINVACLEGAKFDHAKIYSTAFAMAQVNGATVFAGCEFDEKTDFTGVALDAAIIDPGLKAALKNNIRRFQWHKWAKDAPTRWQRWLRGAINLFWGLSDYGSSTAGIAGSIGDGYLYIDISIGGA